MQANTLFFCIEILMEEEEIRSRLQFLYKTYLDNVIGDETGMCSNEIYLPYRMYVNDQKQIVNPGEGADLFQIPRAIITLDEFQSVFKTTGYTLTQDIHIAKGFRDQTKEDVALITSFLELCEKPHFLLSIRIVAIGSKVGHQTILVFDKTKKECIVIEPQVRMERVMTIYTDLLNRLGLTEYNLIEPSEQCVQAVAKDKNCMFWSLLLVTKYIQGSFPSIDAVSKSILADHPTPESLKTYIDQFKAELYKNEFAPGLSKGAKRQWASSTANRSKKRRKRTHRLPKNKSKSLKSARHTQRRV